MNIEWNEDKTKGTLSAEDIKKLESNFNNGYGKGQETGKKDIIKLFSFLEIDESNFESSIELIKQKLVDLKEGKLPKEITDKIKGSEDVIKDLETKLAEKTGAFTSLQTSADAFKRSHLIDGRLIELGRRKETEAIDAQDAAILFKRQYSVELGETGNLVLKSPEGNAIFTEAGDPLTIEQAFTKFAETKKALFKAAGNGGSGGGGEGSADGDINPWDKEHRNLTKQAEILKKDPALAERLKKSAKK